MSKRKLNPSASDTIIQINSTLSMLQEKKLSILYNQVNDVDPAQHVCRITWRNHCPGRANTGKAFGKLEQYRHILYNNSYHCLLFDGSIIRVNFEFEDNILLTQNLLWWPAPYNYGDLLEEGFPPVELLDNFYEDSKWYNAIKMRSPIRIDFDNRKNKENHSRSHMHIQHEETRLYIKEPICFNKFIDFVFRNFYPGLYVSFSPFDFINYNTTVQEEITYSMSEMVI